MLRRSLRRLRRYPSLTLFVAGIPVVLMLLFVYVFGGISVLAGHILGLVGRWRSWLGCLADPSGADAR